MDRLVITTAQRRRRYGTHRRHVTAPGSRVITTAQRRRRYGGTVSVESRFLDEVGLEDRLQDYDTPDDQIP